MFQYHMIHLQFLLLFTPLTIIHIWIPPYLVPVHFPMSYSFNTQRSLLHICFLTPVRRGTLLISILNQNTFLYVAYMSSYMVTQALQCWSCPQSSPFYRCTINNLSSYCFFASSDVYENVTRSIIFSSALTESPTTSLNEPSLFLNKIINIVLKYLLQKLLHYYEDFLMHTIMNCFICTFFLVQTVMFILLTPLVEL